MVRVNEVVRLTPDQGLLDIKRDLGLDEVLMVTIGTTQRWIPVGSLYGWLHLLIRIGDVCIIMTGTVPQGGTGRWIGLLTHKGLETYPDQSMTIGMKEVLIGLLFLGLLLLLVHLGGRIGGLILRGFLNPPLLQGLHVILLEHIGVISRSPVHLGLLQLPGERNLIRDLLERFLQLQFLQLLDLIGAFIRPLLLILMFLP